MSTPAPDAEKQDADKAWEQFLERGAAAMALVRLNMKQQGREIPTTMDFAALIGHLNIGEALAKSPLGALIVADGFAAGQQAAETIEGVAKAARIADGFASAESAVNAAVEEAKREAARAAQQQSDPPPRTDPEREPPANDADPALSEKAA